VTFISIQTDQSLQVFGERLTVAGSAITCKNFPLASLPRAINSLSILRLPVILFRGGV
jgi:hypothetical protein